MKLRSLYSWQLSVKEAKDLQLRLAPMVSQVSTVPDNVRFVAGLDISPPGPRGTVRGAVVILSYPDLELEEVSVAEGEPGLPYIPGLLSFRETPVLLEALEKLELSPDILIVDGHGLAHPRRFGLACHIGLLADTPTIGCAKSVLTGTHGPPGGEKGCKADLIDHGEVVGTALRTRADVRPVYVSVGHRIDLASAARLVLGCCKGRRLPESTRLAHQAAASSLAPGQRSSSSGLVSERNRKLRSATKSRQ